MDRFDSVENTGTQTSAREYRESAGLTASRMRDSKSGIGSTGKRSIFALTWITYAGFYFCRKNLSIALPLLEGTRALSHLDMANIIFGYSLFYAVGQLACGPLADRFGPRRIVGAGLLLIVASNLLMCLYGSLGWLLPFACLNGLGQSSGWSGLVKMMGNWFEGGKRGIVMAFWSTNYVLGGFLATAFATWAVTQQALAPALGWRRGFLFPSLILLAISIAFWLFARNTPRESAYLRPAFAFSAKDRPDTWKISDMVRLLRSSHLWTLGTSYFFLELCRYALMFWLPFFLVKEMQFSLEQSGYLSSLYELVGVVGTLLAGYVSDRFMQSRRAPVSAIMLFGFGIVVLLPALFPHPGFGMVAVGIGLAGLLTYGPDTLLSGAAAQDVGNGVSTATTAGLIDGIGHLGSLLSPYLVVLVSARYSWNTLFMLFAGAAFLSAFSLIPIWRLRPADSVAV
jgi:sugar phosphate permease